MFGPRNYLVLVAATLMSAALASCQCGGAEPRVATQPRRIDITERLANADLDKLIGEEITIQGPSCYNSFTDCVWVQGSNQMFFLNRMGEGWPPGLPPNADVQVRGTLAKRKFLRDPVVTESGEIVSNGIPGEQYMIDHARWAPVDAHVVVKPKVYSIQNCYGESDFDPMVGHLVTVEGVAVYGADKFGVYMRSVIGDGARVYVDGVKEWPSDAIVKAVRVTGSLTVQHDRPRAVLGPYGEISVKADGPRFVITDAHYEFFDLPSHK